MPEGGACKPFTVLFLPVPGWRRLASSLPESKAVALWESLVGLAQLLSLLAGARMEGAGKQDVHVHRAPRLAHRLTARWEVQEDTQKYYDQSDGHPGGGHQEAGENALWVPGTGRIIGR